MNIYREFKPSLHGCGVHTVATLGTFDGVHLGHQAILDRVVDSAARLHVEPVVLTFARHPISVIKPEITPKLLTTLDEKLAHFERCGIQSVYVLSFTKEIAEMTAEQFITHYLIGCLGMEHFVVGYDHGFGKGRHVSSAELEKYSSKYHFGLDILPPVVINGKPVKSSFIRELLLEGKVGNASELLGSLYSLEGTIIEGSGVGKKIGFPTANMVIQDTEKIIPATGVYTGWITFDDEQRDALIVVGSSPTFETIKHAIEIHIPGFTGNLYRKKVRTEFSHRLRDLEKFHSRHDLIRQISMDIEQSKQFLTHKT